MAALGNVGLDVLLVAVFRWGVSGSAWATALAQALSALFAAVLLYRRYPEIRLHRKDLPLDKRTFGHITGLALPIALQSAFNNLSNVVAQSGIKAFGETVMAAYTAASRETRISAGVMQPRVAMMAPGTPAIRMPTKVAEFDALELYPDFDE